MGGRLRSESVAGIERNMQTKPIFGISLIGKLLKSLNFKDMIEIRNGGLPDYVIEFYVENCLKCLTIQDYISEIGSMVSRQGTKIFWRMMLHEPPAPFSLRR